MKTQFRIEELEEIIYPDSLIDVLESLVLNGMIESYLIDYRGGDVFLSVPRDVEVKELIAGFQELPDSGRKSGGH